MSYYGLVRRLRLHFLKALLLSVVFISGCTTRPSPRFEAAASNFEDNLTAEEIFQATFLKHGGSSLASLQDVSVAIDGEWYFLITRIQPEVTDARYRQQSEERVVLSPRLYAVNYNGEAGTKEVFRSESDIRVGYNGTSSSDTRKEMATALTADAFYMFALGPLALNSRVNNWKRLEDRNENGNSYYRVNGELKPGIGISDSDFITLWINKKDDLTFRLHITLDGFETTVGAHVYTSFLNYTRIEQFTLPTHFFERVIGPISINAHEWWYTGIDINRGLNAKDIGVDGWSDKALVPAKQYNMRSH